MQNFLFDVVPHLLIFSFLPLAQRDISKIILLRMMSKSLLPMFSSRSFYVLGSFVSVFNPFWVFSGLWCNKVIKFHSFVYVCPAFPTPFIKECLFIVYSCFLCHRLIDRIGVELHSVLYSTPLIYVNVCMLVPCCFDYYSLVV